MHIPPELWGVCSVMLAIVAYVPYIRSIIAGRTRPHAFTWAIWALLTVIAFILQFSQGAGPGAWATGVTGALCFVILAASFRYGERNITRSDWITFIAALAAIPLWLITDKPTLAAIWVTIIDGLGFYPTCRKSWHRPYEEMVTAHIISIVKHVFSLIALTAVNIPTALYPASLVFLNAVLVFIILSRRYLWKPDAASA